MTVVYLLVLVTMLQLTDKGLSQTRPSKPCHDTPRRASSSSSVSQDSSRPRREDELPKQDKRNNVVSEVSSGKPLCVAQPPFDSKHPSGGQLCSADTLPDSELKLDRLTNLCGNLYVG